MQLNFLIINTNKIIIHNRCVDELINGITPLANKIADKLQSHWPSLYQKLASNVFPEQVNIIYISIYIYNLMF